MSDTIQWNKVTLDKFNNMINKMPVFHRKIAEPTAKGTAERNALERCSKIVEDVDVVNAFFQEVPHTFYSLMIRLLDDVGFDYKKYKGEQVK